MTQIERFCRFINSKKCKTLYMPYRKAWIGNWPKVRMNHEHIPTSRYIYNLVFLVYIDKYWPIKFTHRPDGL